MAEPFKKQTTRYVTSDGRRCTPDTPGAVKVTEESKTYYGVVPQPDGRRKAVPLCPDLTRSRQLLNKLLADAAMAEHGMGDPYAEHRRKPLSAHLDDFEGHLLSKGCTTDHTKLVSNRARSIVDGCRFATTGDISASAVQEYVAGLRRGGKSIQTCNFYLQAAKQFCRCMVRDRRMADSPLAHLSGGNVKLDRRHERREFTGEELGYLFALTREASRNYKLSGQDRVMLYRTALFTGLRASELASLTPESFRLGDDPPTVIVEAGYSKHRRRDVLPLHPDLVARLRSWLLGKTTTQPVWPGCWASSNKAGAMLKADLERARIAWIGEAGDDDERDLRARSDFLAYRDGEGRFGDFHALRHTFITRLVRAGVNPKEAQTLARHSTITLTMDRYAHAGLYDIASAVGNFPRSPRRTWNSSRCGRPGRRADRPGANLVARWLHGLLTLRSIRGHPPAT